MARPVKLVVDLELDAGILSLLMEDAKIGEDLFALADGAAFAVIPYSQERRHDPPFDSEFLQECWHGIELTPAA